MELMIHYIESVHNVDTLWTDYLKIGILHTVLVQNGSNAGSVRKITDFVDRHYI
jgi:hypothetical protein